MNEILVLYYSRFGATEALAREVSRGVDSVRDSAARLRTVPPVSADIEATAAAVPESGPPYVTHGDLDECSGIVMGSPTRFGNMSAGLKYFIDSTGGEWAKGTLAGKPAGVFTSTSSMHGGSETTLLTMAIPLLHHGMIYVGLPYTEERLSTTTSGGSLYGATHVTLGRKQDALSDDERALAFALGKRVAEIAHKLAD